jgi:hypothetical protein
MKKLTIWAAVTTLVLTGCGSEEITEQHDLLGENGRKAITFSTYLPGHTRGYNAAQASLNSFSEELETGFLMTAVMGDSVIIDGARYYSDAEGECFTADGSAYTWPDEESALSFMAYYPPSADMCRLDVPTKVLTFTPDGETDIMAADTTINASKDEGNVALTFNHLLAHVKMNVACSDDVADASFVLTGLSLEAPESATYFYEKDLLSVAEENKVYSFIASEAENAALTTTGKEIGSVMVPTQQGVLHLLTVNYSVTIGKTTKEYTKKKEIELKAGYVNQLNITVKSDKPILISASVNPWLNGDTLEITLPNDGMTDLSGQDANGRRYIDLGLPSRTLWAAWNIGADSQEKAGGFYAWGETTTKDGQYIDKTYTWICDSEDDPYRRGSGKDELDLADDAAYFNWGEGWCMPSLDQFLELINEEFTTWAYETLGDMPGVRFTSKKFPENSIFLPAAGGNSGDVVPVGNGEYWTRSRYEGSSSEGYSYRFSVSDTDPRAGGMDNSVLRSFGLSVRAVRY